MRDCAEVFGKEEMRKCHARWLERAEKFPSRLQSVVNDVRAMKREKDIQHIGAYAEDTWKRFEAPNPRRTGPEQNQLYEGLNRDFPYGFLPTTGVDSFLGFWSFSCCFIVLQVLFQVRHWFFYQHWRCFDAIVGSNAHFLLEVKTPPPLLPWFSCESFHFSFIQMPLRISAVQSVPKWSGTTLAALPLPPSGRRSSGNGARPSPQS